MTKANQIKKDLEIIKRALSPESPETNREAEDLKELLRRQEQLHREATKGMTPQQIYHFNREAVKGALQTLFETGVFPKPGEPYKEETGT